MRRVVRCCLAAVVVVMVVAACGNATPPDLDGMLDCPDDMNVVVGDQFEGHPEGGLDTAEAAARMLFPDGPGSVAHVFDETWAYVEDGREMWVVRPVLQEGRWYVFSYALCL